MKKKKRLSCEPNDIAAAQLNRIVAALFKPSDSNPPARQYPLQYNMRAAYLLLPPTSCTTWLLVIGQPGSAVCGTAGLPCSPLLAIRDICSPRCVLTGLMVEAVAPGVTCGRGGRFSSLKETLCRGACCCSESFLTSERQSEILVDLPHQSAEGLFSCHIPTRHSAAVA